MKSTLVLASASPRRRELLERVGYRVVIRPPEIDESMQPDATPLAYVAQMAYAKARAISRQPGEWVIAADTIVVLDEEVLHKVESACEADVMLRKLAGRTHRVSTAFAILGEREGVVVTHQECVGTDVELQALDEAVLADYLACGEWKGKAGSYAIQGIGAALVRGIHGSVTNVIGLPLFEVLAALRQLGGPRPAFTLGVSS
ncbi:MAG: Maf family protein [Kofleriaceae bacterium]|nr:Maf family protein [Kofleriaceae bacterium]